MLANVVSEEQNVKAVVQKVQLGEADAGFVYVTDVTSAVADKVKIIDIPERAVFQRLCALPEWAGYIEEVQLYHYKWVTSHIHGTL